MSTNSPNSNSSPNDLPAPGVTGLPLRGSLFSDPAAEVVWSAVQALDEASKHDLLQALGQHLAVGYDRSGAQQQRVARAVAALREAQQLLSDELVPEERPGQLSVNAYRDLRERYPERDWPAPSHITRWIGGGGWNDALRKAHLPTVPGEDVTKVTLGGAFTLDEITAALIECALDLGRLPSFMDYRRWVSSTEVRSQPGRRPQSQPPIDRVCGGWLNALRAAGLIEDRENGVTCTDTATGSGVSLLPRGYRYKDEQLHAALRECAKDLGHSPRVTEYHHWRNRRQREDEEAGVPPTLRPQHSVFNRLYPVWDDALTSAGLEPLGGRGTRSKVTERDGRQYQDEQLIDAVARALDELGDPLSGPTYTQWRTRRLRELRKDDPHAKLPSLYVITQRLGGWWVALDLARSALRRGPGVRKEQNA